MYSAENSRTSYPLSYHHLSPSSTISETDNIFLQTQQNHPQTTLHEESFTPLPLSLTTTPISGQTPFINNMPPNSSLYSPLDASFRQENGPKNWGLRGGKKPPTKRDRHTKISTAQGLRDRRVRLSINIAREFFNLQDLLGFDKASKTLGWLLSKSKVAIDELVRASSSTEEEDNEDEDIKQQELIMQQGAHQSIISKKNRNKVKELDDHGNCGDQNSEREVRREKARARARERTQNKKNMMKIMIPLQDDDHHRLLNQRAYLNLMGQQPCSGATPQNKLTRSSGSSNYNYINCTHQHQEGNNQYNNNDYLMKLALEGNGGFSAFNIINLSTEIHINAKPWDDWANQTQY